jgi:hypothetical protein
MTLKLRPTGLSSGIDKNRPDYIVDIGRIYQTRGGPREYALVLVADDQRSRAASRPSGDPRGS